MAVAEFRAVVVRDEPHLASVDAAIVVDHVEIGRIGLSDCRERGQQAGVLSATSLDPTFARSRFCSTNLCVDSVLCPRRHAAGAGPRGVEIDLEMRTKNDSEQAE
jgi:hypothetical protein